MAPDSEFLNTSAKILIVDDEEDILDLLEYNFEREGYEVFRAVDGEDGLRLAQEVHPDLILLDIMMPKMDGVTACIAMRATAGLEKTPIIFLTARVEEYSEIAGLDAGADDYILKPVKMRVLKSRVKAMLRRQHQQVKRETNVIYIHELEIIRDEDVVKINGQPLALPRKEFELFYFLASRPGKVYSREDLLLRIWDNVHVTDRTVDVHVRKLREKIGPQYIVTVKGVGYKFLPQ